MTVRLISAVGPTAVILEGPSGANGYDLPYLGLKILQIPTGSALKGFNQVGAVSDERSLELTGQYLFIAAQTKASEDTFLDNPVAKRLRSVKAGRVVAGIGPGYPEFGGASILGSYGELVAMPALAEAFEATGTKS